MRPFVPLVANAHLLTILGNYWPRHLDTTRFPVHDRLIETEPGARILVHSQRPVGEPQGEVVLVHGLEGSSTAGYACSLAQALLAAGYAVHRFNMRSCGGTEAICGGSLYHSGQTGDVLTFLRVLRKETSAPLFAVGFSLGGNVVLKMAGELGESAAGLLAGVCGVSVPIDLAACAHALGKRENILYARRFISRLKMKVQRKAATMPGLFDLSRMPDVRTIWDFDDAFTAPAFGFGTAANYYATQSCGQFLVRICVPTLLIQAKDDPLIPFAIFEHPAFRENPFLALAAVEHGGHLGFISRVKPRIWLDGVLVQWIQETRNNIAAALIA